MIIIRKEFFFMRILGLYDIDETIKVNGFKEVTSQRIERSPNVFHPDGLFSEEIFGQTEDDRMYRWGYIKLPLYIFNPDIAKTIILRSGGIIKKMAYGEVSCNLVNGVLVAAKDGQYTGLKDLYKIWEQIDIKKTLTTRSQENIDILTKTPKRLLFNNKIMVLPPGMRPIGTRNGKKVKNELNTIYSKILGLKSITAHTTRDVAQIDSKFQDAAIDIYTFCHTIVAGKNGFFQRNLLAKNTMWTCRNVISAPSYSSNECDIGIFRTGYPLHSCCSLFEPLIRFQMKQILSYNNLENMHPTKGEIKSSDIANLYDDRTITELIHIYEKNPGSRFKPIFMDPEGTKPVLMQYLDIKKNEMITRPLTLTDVVYQAAYSAIVDADRLVYTVRYPIGDHMGAFFTRVHVLSTNQTLAVDLNGKRYKTYPNINPELDHRTVAKLFAETLVPSNSRLPAICGDYDGDTVKSTGIFSDEANEKARKLMYSKIYLVTPQCTTPFGIGKEFINGLYGLTKIV